MVIVLCGIGNRERGDDGFGPYIIDHVLTTERIKKIDCGLYPENYLNKIISFTPDLVIFFDTMQASSKFITLLRNDEITKNAPISVTTHNLPFTAMYHYIKKSTEVPVWFVGVKPRSYEHMTPEIIAVASRIIEFFYVLDKKKKITIINVYETLSTTLR